MMIRDAGNREGNIADVVSRRHEPVSLRTDRRVASCPFAAAGAVPGARLA